MYDLLFVASGSILAAVTGLQCVPPRIIKMHTMGDGLEGS